MDKVITPIISIVKQRCIVCSSWEHKWFQVYYDDNSKLKKANNSWMAWCETEGEYVFKSTKII